MARVELKGIATVKAKGTVYHYAWRGGPRLRGEPGSAEFIASYIEAHDQRRKPDNSRFRSLVTAYKASADYESLAESTRRNWGPWLDRIAERFGDLSVAQFDRPEKIRPVIRQWRAKFAETPRSADYGLQVLSRVLSYAVDPLGRIATNPCEGIKYLYTSDRSDIIWLDADITQMKAGCSAEIARALDLAAATGLRQGDLLRLNWSHIGDNAIVMPTGKSGQHREALVPIYDGLRDVLASIPKRSTRVLTNSYGRPWTKDGFGSSWNKAKTKAGLADRDLHFHDLRGNAATRFYLAGIPERAIAEIMAWSEERVARIIRKYVGRQAATQALILQLNQAKRGT